MKKRILSLVLCLALAFTLAPSVAAWPGPGGGGQSDNQYNWSVASITPKGGGSSGYTLAAASGNVNTAENVTVYTSDNYDENNPESGTWTVLAPSSNTSDDSNATNTRYVKIEPADGYYVQYLVVACNDNTSNSHIGLNCQSVGNGSAYTASFDAASGTIILDTKEEGFYHGGRGAPYHILIQLAEMPSPVYIIYDAGDAYALFSADNPVVSTTLPNGAEAAIQNGGNVAFQYPDDTKGPTHTVLTPTATSVEINSETYVFAGWKATYYSGLTGTNIDGWPTFSGDLSDTYHNPVFQPNESIQLSTYITLEAQWEKVNVSLSKTAKDENGTDVDEETVATGTEITYTITVENTGEVELSDVTVSDTMFPDDRASVTISSSQGTVNGSWSGTTYTISSLASGETVTFTYTYKTTGEETDGEVSSSVTVKADDIQLSEETTTTVQALTASKAPVTNDKVELTISDGSEVTLKAGTDYTVVTATTAEDGTTTYSAFADGDGAATILYAVTLNGFDGAEFTVSDDGATYKGYTGAVSGVTESDGTYTVTLSGAEAVLYFTKGVTIASGDSATVENTAIVNNEETSSENVTVTKAVEHVTIEKSVSVVRDGAALADWSEGDNVQVGDVLTYTIEVTNDGNQVLTEVTITDTFTGSVAPVASSGADVTWGLVGDGSYKATWTIAELDVRDNATLTYTYTVQDADQGETLTNTAAADGDLPPEDDTVEIPVEEDTPDTPSVPSTPTYTLTLTKVDADDNDTKLSGARFDLYRVGASGDVRVGSYTTGATGIIHAVVSVTGDYYWVETQPPTGYTLDDTPHYTSTDYAERSIVVENTKTETPPSLNGEDHYAYVIGYPDGMVHPEAEITRAEVATIFFRLLTEEARSAYMTRSNDFTDVAADEWYNTAVSTMAAMGIVSGYPDGSFQPDAAITRAEFAAIAARFDASGAGITAASTFTDISGHWAESEINQAAANGWVAGYEDGSFRPDRNITRAEAMALVNRVLNRNPESEGDLLADMITWPDNMDTEAWYYLDVGGHQQLRLYPQGKPYRDLDGDYGGSGLGRHGIGAIAGSTPFHSRER